MMISFMRTEEPFDWTLYTKEGSVLLRGVDSHYRYSYTAALKVLSNLEDGTEDFDTRKVYFISVKFNKKASVTYCAAKLWDLKVVKQPSGSDRP